MNFIQNQYKKDLLLVDWAVSKKEQNALVNMAYYKSHSETRTPLNYIFLLLQLSDSH